MKIQHRFVPRSAMAAVMLLAVTGSRPLALAADTPSCGATIGAAEEKRLQERYESYRKVGPDYVHAGEAALERWQDWKWGLRIHDLYYLHIDWHDWDFGWDNQFPLLAPEPDACSGVWNAE
ncbi:MAG: hypothetical protein WCP35_12085 [Verrucomicrobiota bacterium]